MATTNRRFGVEIEHGNLDGYASVARQLREKFPNWNNVTEDGSGVEVRSPILKGKSGLDELGEVMEFLVSIGGWVSTSDGMHVHHDGGDVATDADSVLRVLESYSFNQPVIDTIVDPHRKTWSEIDPGDLRSWKANKVIRTGRRNVHFSRHGTFEFRQFEGCLDPVKAAAWIEFGQRFLDSAIYGHKNPIACANAPDVLFRRIGLRGSALDVLADRPARSQLLPYNKARDAAHKRQLTLV
jgi:hypothetical protein